MGISTKGLVTKANTVNIFKLASVLQSSISPFSLRGASSGVIVEIRPSSEMIAVRFLVQNDSDPNKPLDRQLNIFFNCCDDRPEYGDDFLVLNIGCWGDSFEIMTAVTKAIANLAGEGSEAYVLRDDSTDEGFVKV